MRVLTAAALATLMLAPMAGSAAAQYGGSSCGELWYARNEIYKAGGYCFRTQRGIRAFGNAGCQYDDVEDVPLSANQRREVAEIQRMERIKGCPR
jgi:YARHG domain